ncbi:hypothetical protein MUP79_08715 [Candidatus Bathyarchaeota archaeon]|nr:hypothetical protein [Candidatus Bathyarchaeota archaeon]
MIKPTVHHVETMLAKKKGEVGYAFYRVLGPKKPQKNPTLFLITALDSEYELPYYVSYSPEKILEKTGNSVLPEEYTKPRQTFVTFCFGIGAHVARWKPDSTVTLEELCGWMLQQLDLWGVHYRLFSEEAVEMGEGRNPTIVVLSHYMISEIQHVTEGAEVFRSLGAGYVGYARFADEPQRDELRAVRVEAWKFGIKFTFIDTYPIFGMGLEKLTAGSPYPKRKDEDLWHGKMWRWWRAHPSATFIEDPETFWTYAENDVRGLLFAVNHWRALVWHLWNVDILVEKTFGAIALRILRGHYLSEPTEPWIQEKERGLGEMGKSRKTYVYDSRNPVWLVARDIALDGYKGGIRATMKPGYTTEPVYHYDVSKEYTVAAIMAPLPNPHTDMKTFYEQNGLPLSNFDGHEGIVECEFKFPEITRYPCLPVEDAEVGLLLFPLEGRATCGLAEVRLAARLGAEIQIYRGFTFIPGPDEVHHSVRRFLEDVLQRANDLKGSPGEKFFKNIANGLVGKLCQRNRYEANEKMFGKTLWKDKFATAGPGWSPLLAALILSRARSIYSELLTLGDVVYGHTDSIFSLIPIDMNAAIVQEMRRYGGDLKDEGIYQPFWSPRGAVFWGRKVNPDGTPKLDVEGKPLIDTARQAVSSDKAEFARIVGDRLGKKEGPSKLWFIHTRQPKPGSKEPPGHAVVKITQADLRKYDDKRKLDNPNYDGWIEQVNTSPWCNAAELIAFVKMRRKQNRKGGVKIIASDFDEMRRLRASGVSVNEVARRYPQYSRKTVQRRLRSRAT